MSIILFKISFTAKDAPELIPAVLQPLVLSHTTALARIAFLLTTLLALLLILHPRPDRSATTSTRQTIAILTLLLTIQTRLTNIPTLAIALLQHTLLSSLALPSFALTTSTLILANASFFLAGGTNAISSLDLSNAYNGVTTFSASAVGVQLFVSNWAGPVFWSVGGLLLILSGTETREEAWRAWRVHVGLLTVFMAVAVGGVMAACAVLRQHLFVWTVFSPKFLYVVAWELGWHLGFNLAIGGLVVGLWTL